jgi:hypothetical protein
MRAYGRREKPSRFLLYEFGLCAFYKHRIITMKNSVIRSLTLVTLAMEWAPLVKVRVAMNKSCFERHIFSHFWLVEAVYTNRIISTRTSGVYSVTVARSPIILFQPTWRKWPDYKIATLRVALVYCIFLSDFYCTATIRLYTWHSVFSLALYGHVYRLKG